MCRRGIHEYKTSGVQILIDLSPINYIVYNSTLK